MHQVLDEIADDIRHDLSLLSADEVSPIAIAALVTSSNLSEQAVPVLENLLTASLQRVGGLRQVYCAACRSVRSRIEGQDWVVTRGIASHEDSKRLSQELGIKVFLFAELGFVDNDDGDHIVLDLRIVRASSSVVVFAKRYLSTETRAAYRRKGVKKKSDAQHLGDTMELLKEKPNYVHEVSVVSVNLVDEVDAVGVKYRIAEAFGRNRRWTYGATVHPYLTTNEESLNFGGTIQVDVGYTLTFANKQAPRLRIGPLLGLFIGRTGFEYAVDRLQELGELGGDGSDERKGASMTPVVGVNVAVITHMQLGLQTSLMYLMSPEEGVDSEIATSVAVSWLWD